MAASNKNKHHDRPAGLRRLVPNFWILAMLFIMILELGFINLLVLVSDLPGLDAIEEYTPPLISEIYDHDGTLLSTVYTERRRLVKLDDLPPEVVQAFLAAEDAEFYTHQGIDFSGIGRAAFANYRHGQVKQGGSTITQQVVCNILLSRERTIERKAREAILAVFLERKMGKDQILSTYLNLVYFGSGAHGVEEAALTYFGVPAKDLSLAQAAMMAGVIQAPSRLSPRENFDAAKKRQEYVLAQMVSHHFISAERADEAAAEELTINESWPPVLEPVAPYYLDAVRAEMLRVLGEDGYRRGGYQVYTALDRKVQADAELAVKQGVERLNPGKSRWGVVSHRVPDNQHEQFLVEQTRLLKRRVEPLKPGDLVEALITGYEKGSVVLMVGDLRTEVALRETPWQAPSSGRRRRWSREVPIGNAVSARVVEAGENLKVDLVRKPSIEAALVSIDPITRKVKAIVGGYDYALSQYNRATLSRRPPGSAMKPFVYSAAFSTRDWTPSSIIVDNDAPIGVAEGWFWRPKNYSGGYYGPTSLHHALVNSRNVVTAKLAYRIGIQSVIDRAHLFGIHEDFPPALSISLGACGVSLMELVNAYGVFASEGRYQPPMLITHIIDRDGRVIYGEPQVPTPVISAAEAYQMTYILNKVTTSGTATRAQAIGRRAAGKTGTTSDWRDSWFVGFTPDLVTGVWVGRDDFKPMGYGLTGSKGALPIWVSFMRDALSGTPKTWFEAPAGVYFRYGLCFLDGTRANQPAVGSGGDEDEEILKKKPDEEEAPPPDAEPRLGEDEAVGEALSEAGHTNDQKKAKEQPSTDSASSLMSNQNNRSKSSDNKSASTSNPAPDRTSPAERPRSDPGPAAVSTNRNSSSSAEVADLGDQQSSKQKLREILKSSRSPGAHDAYANDGHY